MILMIMDQVEFHIYTIYGLKIHGISIKHIHISWQQYECIRMKTPAYIPTHKYSMQVCQLSLSGNRLSHKVKSAVWVC